MRFLFVGAGAVGAYMGAKMSQAGFDVVLHARGPHLRAMQENGVRVIGDGEEFTARPKAIGDLAEAGPVDVVFLCVKAHGVPSLAPLLAPVLGPETAVVSTQNGIPWWYFQGIEGPLAGSRLERVDPGGVIAAAIEARRVIGSLIYFATEIEQPGVVRHNEGNRITLGEPAGNRSDRIRLIAQALVASGLKAPVTTNLRTEIWVKILGNVAFNPISALTRATLGQMIRHEDVNGLVRSIMQEVQTLAGKMGIEMPISIDQRIEGAARIGEHKPSMLQDMEAGRPLEVEAIVGAIIELGERAGVEMPSTRAVYACTKLMVQCRDSAEK